MGLNGVGTVTGYYYDASNIVHGFSRGPSPPHPFVTFDAPGSVFGTIATSINSAGKIVGFYRYCLWFIHGFLRTP